MKHVVSLLAVLLCSLATNVFCSERPMPLRVKTMKHDLTFYVTPQTFIGDLKDMIADEEGIPASQQKLIKSEGWALQPQWGFTFPLKKLTTILENGQSCGQYDLQPDQQILLQIKLPKSPAQITAELQARRQVITAALLQNPFPQPIVDLVAAHDTHNED